MELKQDLAAGIGKTVTFLLIAFIMAMALLFISLGTAIVLAEELGDFWGFGIVGLFYILVTVMLVINQETLSKKLTRHISENFKKKK
jgi:hypothetical protein